MMLQPFKVCWWDDPETDLDTRIPWWPVSLRHIQVDENTVMEQYSLTAAVMAIGEEDAKRQIAEAYSDDVIIEWRSIVLQPFGWSPFSRRTPRHPEMIWDQRPH